MISFKAIPIFAALFFALCSQRAASFSPSSAILLHGASRSNIGHGPHKLSATTGTSKPFFFVNDDIVDANNDEKQSNDAENNDKEIVINKKSKTNIIAGATGYIGRAVVAESVRQGYNTIALVRNATYLETPDGIEKYGDSFTGATTMEADVEDASGLADLFAEIASEGKPIQSVISCLASPIGTKREAYAIDYQATLNCMNAGRDDRVSAQHFVLLSAFCVRRPLLQLQQAKLEFEAELTSQTDMTYSIVRPTAFFKSVSGQLEGIQQGAPYVLFGDGAVTRCNPIAEDELAEFMVDSITDESRHQRIMNIGGPDEPLTNQMLGQMMYRAIGEREPKFVYAPTWIFDYIINALQFVADATESDKWEDAAETARIGKYYACEDMLTTDPEEKYGTIYMQDHYNKIAAEGQDKFTPVRATAFISRFLEALPAVGTAAPIAFFLNPKIVEHIVSATPTGLDLSFMVASTDNLLL